MRIKGRNGFTVLEYIIIRDKSLNLTSNQWKVLATWFLQDSRYPVFNCHLSKRLQVSEKTVSRAFSELVKKGYLSKTKVPYQQWTINKYKLTDVFITHAENWDKQSKAQVLVNSQNHSPSSHNQNSALKSSNVQGRIRIAFHPDVSPHLQDEPYEYLISLLTDAQACSNWNVEATMGDFDFEEGKGFERALYITRKCS